MGYAHDACNRAARGRGAGLFFRGLPAGEILIGGFCELFTRKVMRANEQALGEINPDAYRDYYQAAGRIALFAGDLGEDQPIARAAYFGGNAAAIEKLFQVIKEDPQGVMP